MDHIFLDLLSVYWVPEENLPIPWAQFLNIICNNCWKYIYWDPRVTNCGFWSTRIQHYLPLSSVLRLSKHVLKHSISEPCYLVTCAPAVQYLQYGVDPTANKREGNAYVTYSLPTNTFPIKRYPHKNSSYYLANAWNEILKERISSFPCCVMFIMFTSRQSVIYPLP